VILDNDQIDLSARFIPTYSTLVFFPNRLFALKAAPMLLMKPLIDEVRRNPLLRLSVYLAKLSRLVNELGIIVADK
jgi:hypothetical protein